MSLKDLFGKTSEQIVVKQDLEKLYKEVESEKFVEELTIDKNRYLPAVDFSSASNFARYGSAERYYVDGFKYIYQNYPYDGSRKEKQEWRNLSSQLDLYIFDNLYPRTTGYVNLDSNGTLGVSSTYRSGSAAQYIKVKGGPNKSPNGNFETANIYDLETNRESNLGITSNGNTVEFWFKDNLTASSPYYANAYALFDLWNGQSATSASYTRLTIEKANTLNKFVVTYRSGSAGVTSQTLDYTFDSSVWHHYAFTFANLSSDLEVCLFIDGNLALRNVLTGGGGVALGNNLNNIAHIGALRSGLGVSCGAFDEFRFWKTARTSQQIYRNWFTTIGGGTNTDDSNTDLGLYLKFNEGIVDSTKINDLDKICLDYSGRASNGTIINYGLNCKNTGSAIDDYLGETKEEKDPIVFSSNPLVLQLIEQYTEIGSVYDATNQTNIYNSIPSWITEEAENKELKDLSYLIQIIASYFDTLHVQIEAFSKIKNVDYDSESKPKPFTRNLLSSVGFENLDLFNDATFLENVLSTNEQQKFDEKIYNIKNFIYQNIYNNLPFIYKSKGTEKSLRNLIRCFGVDDELVKINLYANNTEYDLTTKYIHTSITKKFVDFNNPDRYEGVIYQKSKTGDSNTKGYITGSADNAITYIPITAQAEVIFPKRPIIEAGDNTYSTFITSSIFGIHQADNNEAVLNWGSDLFNFQVYSIRRNAADPEAKFRLVGSFNGSAVDLTSSFYKDVYNNEKWNLTVRIKPKDFEHVNLTTGSKQPDYWVEFVGVNSNADTVSNMFNVSASVSYANMSPALKVNKRVYAGAHYTNFNTSSLSLLDKSDVKIGSIRYWLDYLNNDELIAHSYEANNFGRQQPNWPPAYFESALSSSIPLARSETLALHWNFFNVSSSNSSGQFIVDDISSGSVDAASTYGLTWLNNIIRYQMPGFADAFIANDTQVVNKEYVFSGKKQNPESLSGNDLVQVVDTDDLIRTKDTRVVSYYLAVEKSAAQVINDEIMNWFATIKSYNNLIGTPTDKFKQEYDGLRHLRELFFSKVNNSISFERFFEFYKWIDSSLSAMINQLVPISVNSSDRVRNMVESHMLERSKYQNKLPTIELSAEAKSYPVTSHLEYKYTEQAAGNIRLEQPLSVSRYFTFKPQWLKQRAIRTETPVNTVLEPQNDIDREVMRQVINHRNIDDLPMLYQVDNTGYEGREDTTKIFTKIFKFSTDKQYIIEDTIIPVNIKNIPVQGRFIFADEIEAASSASQIIPAKQKYNRTGNYQRAYETVMMSGRLANNKSIEVLEGQYADAVNILAPSGALPDRTLPVRATNKNVVVERFSAPGGREVSSRGFLDAAAEEYSVYNSLNHRNFTVRKVLSAWLTQTSSISENNPSYHQVNKNVSYSPDPDTGLRTADYDNWNIQHQIPQSDQQYSWITASLSASLSASAYFSEFTNLAPNTSSYQFITVSKISANDRTLNTASNTLTHNSYADYTASNGAYSWPSWKQVRTYENPLVVASRKKNNILVQDVPTPKVQTKVINGVTYVIPVAPPAREQTFTAYREPPVAYHKPMEHEVSIADSPETLKLTNTYDNNTKLFSNPDLTVRVGREERDDLQTHDILVDLQNGSYVQKPEIKSIKYSSMIYPSNELVGLKDVRIKSNYDDDIGNTASVVNTRTFWRDDADNRARGEFVKDIYDLNFNSFSILSNAKALSLYNDATNVVVISGLNNARESLFVQDSVIETISGNFSYNNPPRSLINIAYFDSNKNFKQLGIIDGSVNFVVSASDGIYAGGSFQNINGGIENVYNFARWDGNKWNSLAPVYGGVKTAISGADGIYVGGSFNVPALGIFKWDGLAASSVGGDPYPSTSITVYNIFSASSGLYIAGDKVFFDTNTSTDIGIAKWDGSSWDSGSNNFPFDKAHCISSSSQGLFVGADDGVYIYNGTSWSILGTNTINPVYAILSASEGLYAGGDYLSNVGSFVGIYNGSWTTVGNGLDAKVVTLVSCSEGVYAGGWFDSTDYGATPCPSIALWNGLSWQPMSKLLPNDTIVNSIFSCSLGVIFAGDFYNLGSYNVNNYVYDKYYKGDLKNNNLIEQEYYIKNNILYQIEHISVLNIKENNIFNIRKDLNPYSELLSSPPGFEDVSALVSGSNSLYIGGNFTTAGNNTVNYLAEWDGNDWNSLNFPLANLYISPPQINVLFSASDGLYAGGSFYLSSSTSTTSSFIKWNGNFWEAIKGTSGSPDWGFSTYYPPGTGYEAGYQGTIYALLSASEGIYVTGDFSYVNGAPAKCIALWNGSTWDTLLAGPTNPFFLRGFCLLSASDGLYVGGANTIEKWNGVAWTTTFASAWTYPGSYNGGDIYTMASKSDGIYIGGNFGALNFPAFPVTTGLLINDLYNIARWDGSNWNSVDSGLNKTVNAFYKKDNDLYIGGAFTAKYDKTLSLNNIAKLNNLSFKQLGSDSSRNGFNIFPTDVVYGLNAGNNDEIYIYGQYFGTRSGIKILDSDYNYYTEGYYISGNTFLIPTPQLTFNNFIPPSEASNMIIRDKNINGYHKINIINENYIYETDKISGKKPFFDSYEKFAEDLKPQSQKYSIAPEYTISDYMPIYVKEKNGLFTQPLDQDYLKIDGTLQEQGFQDINDSINIGSNLNLKLTENAITNNQTNELTLKISGIKKLLPYRGFYPSERIVQLSSDFINSFLNLNTKITSATNSNLIFSSSLSNNSPINYQILTLLQPLMAPGILLNTIKSSIAVDWPTFICNSGSYDAVIKPQFYANTGSELIANVLYNEIIESYINYTASNYINEEFNYRFPFESIIEFDKIGQDLVKDENNLYYLNPTYYTTDILTGSYTHLFAYPSYNMGTGSLRPFVFQDDNYKLGMHNFLAEIPNFFLKGKLTSIISLPESKFKSAKKGTIYYMDVVLEKDSKYKEFIADPYYEALKKQSAYHGDGTFLLPSPDSLYGPPTRYWDKANPDSLFYRGPYNFYSKLFDTPAYAPYVPPYYYGKAIARISFTADDSRKYTLAEIQSSASIQFINTEAQALFAERSNFISGNFVTPYTDNYSNSPAYKQIMTVSSSLNLFGEADQKTITYDVNTNRAIEAVDKQDPFWVIQTKFETPSINFSDADTSNNIGLKLLGGEENNGVYSYTFKGMWTTYGQPVKSGEGIKIYIQDSYPQSNVLTGSLIDLCGFTNDADKKTIGLLAESKKINEGVVVIPYNTTFVADSMVKEILGENGIYTEAQRGQGPYYYKIDKNIISRLLDLSFDNASYETIKKAAEASKNKNNSIIKLINSMTKYVIPPHLDWLRNKDIDPFVMYIADFSTTFDREDLSDIWQGLMPKQSRKAEIENITISHTLGTDELFHGKKIENDTKYKIFKVKQRANINYYKLTDDSSDDERFRFTFGNSQQATVPEYSYNWPYDYFSLVELVNIEASLTAISGSGNQ